MKKASEDLPQNEAVPSSVDILSAMSSLDIRHELLDKLNSAFSEIARLQNEEPQEGGSKKVKPDTISKEWKLSDVRVN